MEDNHNSDNKLATDREKNKSEDQSLNLDEKDAEILDRVEKAETKEEVHRIIRTMRLSSGPLPSAETIEQYETIVPGAGDRIITLAEKEQEHRINRENKIINYETKVKDRNSLISIIFVAIIILAVLGVFTYLAVNEHTSAAIGLITVGALGTFASVFVKGSNTTLQNANKSEDESSSNKDSEK